MRLFLCACAALFLTACSDDGLPEHVSLAKTNIESTINAYAVQGIKCYALQDAPDQPWMIGCLNPLQKNPFPVFMYSVTEGGPDGTYYDYTLQALDVKTSGYSNKTGFSLYKIKPAPEGVPFDFSGTVKKFQAKAAE